MTYQSLLFPEFRDDRCRPNLLIAVPVSQGPHPILKKSDDGTATLQTSSVAIVTNPRAALKLNSIRAEEHERPVNISETRLKKYCELAAANRSAFSYGLDSVDEGATYKFSALTKRELELVSMLWQGFKTHDIAIHWHRSELTVTKHRENLNTKLGHKITPQDMYAIRATQAIIGDLV